MMAEVEELLVIFGDDGAEEALAELSNRRPVTHVVSRRVVVVQHPTDEPDVDIRAIPGVAAVMAAEVPPEFLATLDETEAMFVTAWSSRKGKPKKERSGEGLPWDAPGFEPPDPPTH